MNHFVITYFNLHLWDNDKHNNPTRTPEWLESRFEIFERYCLPSFAGQTCSDFTWLCCLGDDTPQRFRDKMEEYRRLVPQIRVVYFTPAEARRLVDRQEENRCAKLEQEIRGLVSPGETYVLTTNCDNDDAVSAHFIEDLQAEAARCKPERTLMSCMYGLQLFLKQGYLLKMRYPHNHFLTLVEPLSGPLRTVEWYGHTRANRLLPTRYLTDRPLWLEVVHGNNVSNALRITSRIRYTFLWKPLTLSEFGLDRTFSAGRNFRNNLLSYPWWWLGQAAKKLSRKISKRHQR